MTQAVRRNNRGLPIDVAALNQFLASKGGRVFLSTPFPSQASGTPTLWMTQGSRVL
jgi:hypothetical protein